MRIVLFGALALALAGSAALAAHATAHRKRHGDCNCGRLLGSSYGRVCQAQIFRCHHAFGATPRRLCYYRDAKRADAFHCTARSYMPPRACYTFLRQSQTHR